MNDRAASKPGKSRGPRLFFVVERDVHVRRLLTDFLEPIQVSVRFFDDGYTALDAVRKKPPRLVVTDVLVPRLDGLALCRLIKRDEALRDVKVVILSAVSAEERARESGADAFLEKPIERERIVELVRTLAGACDPESKS